MYTYIYMFYRKISKYLVYDRLVDIEKAILAKDRINMKILYINC